LPKSPKKFEPRGAAALDEQPPGSGIVGQGREDASRVAAPDESSRPSKYGRRPTPSAALVALLLLVPIAAAAVSWWPGHMSADTLAQIDQVRTGDFTNQHATLLMVLWRPFYLHLDAGPGWVLTGQLLAFVIGSYLVLRAVFRPISAAAVTAAVCLVPPVFGMLGYLGRDTWFTVLLVLTFGLIVRATRVSWPARGAWMGAALVAAWLTLAARQNAVPAVAIACILLAGLLLARWIDRRPAPPSLLSARWRLVLAATAGGIALTIGIVGTQWASNAIVGADDVNIEEYTFIYDLAALSVRERENLFPSEALPSRGMRAVDAYWNADSMLGYVFGPDPPIAVPPLRGEAGPELREHWLDAIRDHPLEYLDVRLDLFLRQIAITRSAIWIYHPHIDPNPYGYSIRFTDVNSAAKDYVEAFGNRNLDGGWIYSIWAYLVLALAAAIVLVRWSRGWVLAAVGSLAVAVLTYQAGLFFSAPVAQSRYEFPIIVAGLLGAAVLLRLAWARRPRRRPELT
jgi:hypothetical protein